MRTGRPNLHSFEVGQRFGRLTLIWVHPGQNGKVRRAHCLCDCGAEYWVNALQVFQGRSLGCRKCVKPRKYKLDELPVRRALKQYENRSARKGRDFSLSWEQFQTFYLGNCIYCGRSPANGIDRKDSKQGYTLGNCSSCCKRCNIAKMDQTPQEFLEWATRVAQHQGASWL